MNKTIMIYEDGRTAPRSAAMDTFRWGTGGTSLRESEHNNNNNNYDIAIHTVTPVVDIMLTWLLALGTIHYDNLNIYTRPTTVLCLFRYFKVYCASTCLLP